MLKTFTMFIRGAECLVTGHIRTFAGEAYFEIEVIRLVDQDGESSLITPLWYGDIDTFDFDPDIDVLDDGELNEIEAAFWDTDTPAGTAIVVSAEE